MEKVSDEKLYELCRQYGKQALEWRNKFAGLLPEVERRKLYLRKGFGSIFEFAFKLAGLSEAQVKLALSLDQKFADKPALLELLTGGKVSAGKLVRVAAVATVENQNFLAGQVRLLPQKALEVLARDMKNEMAWALPGQKNDEQNGLFEMKNDAMVLRAQKIERLGLSEEVVEKLSWMKEKGIDVNELILEFLKKRDQEIEAKKTKIAEEIMERESRKEWLEYLGFRKDESRKISRYIPMEVRKILREENGTKCAVPRCKKAAEEIHHAARFGLVKAHDPRYMAPLCREHHAIAHSMDAKWLEKRGAKV